MRPIYLDYAATTPVDPEVLQTMTPYFLESFGNSASSFHTYGREAELVLEDSRKVVAQIWQAKSKEIFFTSGATESNNWVFRGLIDQHKLSQKPNTPFHILTSQVEHNSVIQNLKHLASFENIEVDFVPVNRFGQVEIHEITKRIRPETQLLSFMWVNNELGVINPIKEIGQLARSKQILFHTDATQAVGKLPIDLNTLPIDLMSCSAHKIYGPKGCGALYIRSPQVRIQALLSGGGQERGQRSGTVNVPGIVGFTKALSLMEKVRDEEHQRCWQLRNQFVQALTEKKIRFTLNGHASETIPQIINITLPDLSRDSSFSQFALSKGSACHSGQSHVLSALHLSDQDSTNTFRISFGKYTKATDLIALAQNIWEKSRKREGAHPVS